MLRGVFALGERAIGMVDAREYHERTNHAPGRPGGSSSTMDPANRPRPFKAYRTVPSISLDPSEPIAAPTLQVLEQRSTAMGAVDIETIATLCTAAAGIVQETEYKGETTRFRAASCTGNLHHIDLYLVVDDLDGLEAGVYHFDPTEVALDVLRRGDFRGTLLEATGHDAVAEAPLSVVVTSTWWRNAWKYTERTYRHAFWDGGTVLANLFAAASALDLCAPLVSGYVDDAVASLIGVDPIEEAPIAIVPIGDGAPVPEAQEAPPLTLETAPLSPDPVTYQMIVDAWEDSRLDDRDAVEAWRQQCREVGTIRPPSNNADRIDLEPVDDATATARPLSKTIGRRGSKRTFAADGPTRRQVGTIVDRAIAGVLGDHGLDPTWPNYCTPVLLATGIDGLDDGTYRLHPDATATHLGPVTSDDQEHLALDQPWAGEAHANCYLMADVEGIVERLGNRGYRLAMLEAGIALGRLYLATAAHRTLGGTGLTFYDEEVTEYVGIGEYHPMTMYALGRIDPETGPRL